MNHIFLESARHGDPRAREIKILTHRPQEEILLLNFTKILVVWPLVGVPLLHEETTSLETLTSRWKYQPVGSCLNWVSGWFFHTCNSFFPKVTVQCQHAQHQARSWRHQACPLPHLPRQVREGAQWQAEGRDPEACVQGLLSLPGAPSMWNLQQL